MCNAIKNKTNSRQSGFTLIEMSIVLVILGLLIAPAAVIYRNYVEQQRWETTENNISLSMTALGGFRASYGRYPCPAPMDAAPGDATYGLEQCVTGAPGTCVNGVCIELSPRAGVGTVLRGALPFKNLDLQESEAYDAYLSRLNYAVTEMLTEDTTFNVNMGGIGLVDASDDSIVTPQDSLHFIITSAGINGAGGFSRAGLVGAPCPAGLLEGENCDGDTIYRQMPHGRNFDDRVSYFSPVEVSQWQISETDVNDIHLKAGNSGNVAIGVEGTVNLMGAESLVVRDASLEPGTVAVTANPGFPGVYELMHSFNVGRLCKYGATDPADDCFTPALIGGQFVDGGGMDCTEGGLHPNRFLVGIRDSGPVCRDEVFVSCPAGEYIVGINADKTLKCNTMPGAPCADQVVTPFCGGTATLPGTFSGGTSAVYSGTCYKLPNYSKATYDAATASMTEAQKIAHVKSWNNTPRTVEDCGPTPTRGMTKDIYQCNAGTWTYLRTHERIYPEWATWWPAFTDATATWAAEQTEAWSWSLDGTGHQVTPDPNNNSNNHDCWCREDYRARVESCGAGSTGNKIIVEKVKCPVTHTNRWYNYWSQVFVDDSQCTCVPGPYTETEDCVAYFNNLGASLVAGSLTGTVTRNYIRNCPPPNTENLPSFNCKCNAQTPIITETACPTGTTNSFTFAGVHKIGIEKITTESWKCPNGAGNPVTTASGAGYWEAPVDATGIPPCVCDNTTLPKIEEKPCPPSGGFTTTGMVKYEVEWDCSLNGGLGDWEPESEWTLIDSSACKSCHVKRPATAPNQDNRPKILGSPGEMIGNLCNCGDTMICREDAGGDAWDIWNSCSCQAN